MKMRLLMLLLVGIMTALPALAATKTVSTAHRMCQNNDECSLITLGCACARTNAKIQAVNKAYASLYQNLGQCTAEQQHECATIKCSRPNVSGEAICKKGMCMVNKLHLPPTKPVK